MWRRPRRRLRRPSRLPPPSRRATSALHGPQLSGIRRLAMSLSLGELAVRFGCELRGDPDMHVERVAPLAKADERSIAFLANPRYRAQLAATRAGAVVLNAASADECPTAVLLCDNPYATFARIATILHPLPQLDPGVHPSAVVAASARIDPSAQVAAYAIVGPEVVVGARAFIGPHCCLEEGVQLAADVRLVARVTLCRAVQIGTRAVLQPGVVIGGDGFGFAPERGTWLKVPQLGTVRIGADVEIGANTTIDRRCMIGGGAGFAGHLTIADDVVITGYSAVTHSIARPGVYSGTLPVEEAHAWRRLVARFKRSGLLETRVRALERAAGLKSGRDEDHD